MDPSPWDAWESKAPPDDFAGRVVAQATERVRAFEPKRGWRVTVGVLVAAAAAVAVTIGASARHRASHGDFVATHGPVEVHVGGRALAVLEKGAHVAWDGDRVTQAAGDVFWRVEPGARFVVRAPGAEVAVKGTCFRVQVEEDEMKKRDVAAGAVGAVASAMVLVGVYEGRVAVAATGSSVELRAGESARADASGLRKTGGEVVRGGGSPSPSADDEAWRAANQNLADSVTAYKDQLDVIAHQKATLEKRLAEAEQKLAQSDGAAGLAGGAPRSEYDLDQNGWKELAKTGTVRMRYPCMGPSGFTYSPGNLTTLGLSPEDGPTLTKALTASYNRTWGIIRPLCAQALGGFAGAADKVGENACVTILRSVEGGNQANEAALQVAEMRAGERPLPGPSDAVDPYEQALLTLTGEPKILEADLAQSLGPEDANRVVFADVGCWNNQSSGARPRGSP